MYNYQKQQQFVPRPLGVYYSNSSEVPSRNRKMKDYYTNLSDERFEEIMGQYSKFISTLTNVNTKPVRVYEPLSQKSIDEINMLRDISKELQKKKEEDMKKAAQAAEETEKAQQEKGTEEDKPEQAPETEKEN